MRGSKRAKGLIGDMTRVNPRMLLFELRPEILQRLRQQAEPGTLLMEDQNARSLQALKAGSCINDDTVGMQDVNISQGMAFFTLSTQGDEGAFDEDAQEGDSVVSVARIAAEELKKVGAKVNGEAEN